MRQDTNKLLRDIQNYEMVEEFLGRPPKDKKEVDRIIALAANSWKN